MLVTSDRANYQATATRIFCKKNFPAYSEKIFVIIYRWDFIKNLSKSLNTTLEPDGSNNPAESNVLTEQELNRCFEDGFDITGSG